MKGTEYDLSTTFKEGSSPSDFVGKLFPWFNS